MPKLDLKLDEDRQVVEIGGEKYAYDVFRAMGKLMPVGSLFRLVDREDGVITIEQIYE